MNSRLLALLFSIILIAIGFGSSAQDGNLISSHADDININAITKQLEGINQDDEGLKSKTNDYQNIISQFSDSASNHQNTSLSKLQGKIDSLKNRLDSLQSNNNLLDSLEAKSANIAKKLDSLQQKVAKIVNTNKFDNHLPGETGDMSKKLPNLPGIEKLKLPPLNTNANSLINSNDLQKYTTGLDDQIGQLGGIDKIKNIIPDKFKNQDGSIPGEYQQYGDMVKDPSKIDGAIDQQAANTDAFKELSGQQGALPGMNDLPTDMLKDLEKYQNYDNIKSQVKDLAIDQAKDFFKGHEEKLNGTMSKMAKLKKKYSYVPDSRDLSTAVKRNSLKGQPLKERLIFGGNFQIVRGNPLSVDLSPYLLYKFNKAFYAGAGGTYRASLGMENNMHAQIVQDVYGVNGIARHKLYKGFFGYGELTYMSRPVLNGQQTTDTPQRVWSEGLLIGIGKKITLSKLFNGNMIFTYDVLHNDRSVSPKAWNIKFGFELGKMSLRQWRGFAKGV